jgi:hypothetical protein
MLPYDIQVMVLAFVLAGLIGWSIWRKATGQATPTPIWTSPEYLRYNRGVTDASF